MGDAPDSIIEFQSEDVIVPSAYLRFKVIGFVDSCTFKLSEDKSTST